MKLVFLIAMPTLLSACDSLGIQVKSGPQLQNSSLWAVPMIQKMST